MEHVLVQAIDRLEAVLASETLGLQEGAAIDLADTATRKNQSLLELSRLSRSLKADDLGERARHRLGGLKRRIEENRRVLELHVAASRDVSEIIARTIRQAESDGTYDSDRARDGRGA